MKRAQIEALLGAHQGRAATVASIHVLRQAALEEDDLAFLQLHAAQLDLRDLLRWSTRCDEPRARGDIVRAMAEAAIEDPQRFRFEALGTEGARLDEHEWGELAEQAADRMPPFLWRAVLARVGGGPTFRALAQAGGEAEALEPAFFPIELADEETLEARVRRAFAGAEGPAAIVMRALWTRRYDESACRRAVGEGIAGSEAGWWWSALARAGLARSVEARWPAETRWWCEGQGSENERLREAFVRQAALSWGGVEGRRWLLHQISTALARGAPVVALLREVPGEVREMLPEQVRAQVRARSEEMSLAGLLSLRGLLPGVVDEEALAERVNREAREGEGDWGPLVRLLPSGLEDALLARAQRTARGDELVALLDALLGRGRARRSVVALAIEALARGVVHRALIGWLSQQLATRSAWEESGAAVVEALLAREALSELNDLLAMAWSQARREGREDPDPPEGFRAAVHGALAEALHAEVCRALGAGDRGRALLRASALACLDPPPRLRGKLGALPSGGEAEGEVGSLLEVVRSLSRHGRGEASLHDAIAAVHALASG